MQGLPGPPALEEAASHSGDGEGRDTDEKENDMEIRLAKTAGFCFGVNRAVELAYGLLN